MSVSFWNSMSISLNLDNPAVPDLKLVALNIQTCWNSAIVTFKNRRADIPEIANFYVQINRNRQNTEFEIYVGHSVVEYPKILLNGYHFMETVPNSMMSFWTILKCLTLYSWNMGIVNCPELEDFAASPREIS